MKQFTFKKYLLLLCVFLPIFFPFSYAVTGQIVHGYVFDENGIPLQGMLIHIYQSVSHKYSTYTDENGFFVASIPFEYFTLAISSSDYSFDNNQYFSYQNTINNYDGALLNISLKSASILILDGYIRLVNTEEVPIIKSIKILVPYTDEVYYIDNYGFLSTEFIAESLVDLNKAKYKFIFDGAGEKSSYAVKVPTNSEYDIYIEFFSYIDERYELNNFTLRNFEHISKNNSLFVCDLSGYMDYNYELFDEFFQKVDDLISEMESLGFYLSKPKGSIDFAEYTLNESKAYYVLKDYDQSFTSCKTGFIELLQTYNTLIFDLQDAKIGVFVLIVFFAITSITIAFFIAQRSITRVGVSVFFYTLIMMILYFVYPTTRSFELEVYVGACIISLITSYSLVLFAPKLMNVREKYGIISLRSILPNIFSIAKRNTHRRRLRFILTLISITLFIASFVSLTSFYEGYGVIVNKIDAERGINGVLIRPNGYSKIRPMLNFLKISEYSSGWWENQPEVDLVTPKVESSLGETSLFLVRDKKNNIISGFGEKKYDDYILKGIQGFWVHGIVGVDPEKEYSFSKLDGSFIQGNLSTKNGIIVGGRLRDFFNLEIGDSIELYAKKMTVEGFFDENLLKGITDLDGSPFVPDKNKGDGSLRVKIPCDPRYVLILNYETALELRCNLNQISILVDDLFNINNFAERIAIERGFWSYASGSNGVFLYKVDKYIEAKGFQLSVPWIVVVLNVIITMLNSMFERKKEAGILSAIGVNPTQLGSIFIAEAAIIGLIGGGIGYLMGLTIYYLVGVFGLTLDISQKISALWSFASILLSFMSVVIGSMVALRYSVILTPSMKRRWKMEDKKDGIYEAIKIPIPINLTKNELKPFVRFFFYELNSLDRQVSKPKIPYIDYQSRYISIPFKYKAPAVLASGSLTVNTLVIDKENIPITMTLESKGDLDFIRETGNLIRNISMKWSLSQQKISNHNNR